MDISTWFFISSGLFLGWSLGANHAVSLFGTAVVSKMVRFRTAAIISGIFVILGSAISGEGATKTLTDLGTINALAGSFAVALAVGISVTLMTRAKLPVSASQAVIGGIIGWNVFTGSPTNYDSLSKIVFGWVASPVIAAFFGFVLFKLIKRTVLRWNIHLLELDYYTRAGLVIVAALASYSLGANNISIVMGMFVSTPLFSDVQFAHLFTITGVQQLFLLGGLAIAIGILTYGDNVMSTVGTDLYKISPITGFIVVLSEVMVLWLFTSQDLEALLLKNNLPAIPLVPLSTTQAFIGAVIGVGLAKDPLSINLKVLGKIAFGWVAAPVTAGIIAFVSLFFIQNVFEQKVILPIPYQISESVIDKLKSENIDTRNLTSLLNKRFDNKKEFRNAILNNNDYSNEQIYAIFNYALIDSFRIDSNLVNQNLNSEQFTSSQISLLKKSHNKIFSHKIDFEKAVFNIAEWNTYKNRLKEKEIEENKIELEKLFRIKLKVNNK